WLRAGGDDRRAVLHPRGGGSAVPARDQRQAAAARALARGSDAIGGGRVIALPSSSLIATPGATGAGGWPPARRPQGRLCNSHFSLRQEHCYPCRRGPI